MTIKHICGNCGKVFDTYKISSTYCSMKCRNIGYKGKHFSKNTEFKTGCGGFTGKHTEETKDKLSKLKFKHGITVHGYKRIRTKNGRRCEHINIIENHINRKLINGEVIHHIDGNKINNNLLNLKLMNRSEHAKLHARVTIT